MQLIERFLRYVAVDTMSDEAFTQIPSTAKQLDLAYILVKEMQELGIADAAVDTYGIVTGTIPANTANAPVIGFIAHMDTSPEVSGCQVQARVIANYDGKDILLHKEKNIVTDVATYSALQKQIGKTLVVSDGTTLLGADDKAGIAIIMTLAQYYHAHPDVPHGTIKLGFTPDEEIGHGTDYFNVPAFGADFAYTLDGGAVGGIDYENFNAASCIVTCTGVSTHPGSAKGKMVNAIHLAMEFDRMLPAFAKPAYTEGYEGFHHLNHIEGGIETAKMHYIIRNHDHTKFAVQKCDFTAIAAFMNARYDENTVRIELSDSYANMLESFHDKMHIIDRAKKAIEACHLTPISSAIRGGTDGARLTYDGLPCPNLGTGGYYCHGRHEFACVEEMELAVEICKHIVEDAAK